MPPTTTSGLDGPELPKPIADHFVTERRRENSMIADMLRQRNASRVSAAILHHARTTLAGFATGSVLVVPLVLLLTGQLMPSADPIPRQVEAARHAQALQPRLVAAPHPAARPPREDAETDPAELQAERIEIARSRLMRREVLAAREILLGADLAPVPEAAFLLAETFDPNVLASLGVTHVAADPERAKGLYETALAAGIASARQRIGALQ